MGNKNILAQDDATGAYGRVGTGAANGIAFTDAGGGAGIVALPAGTVAGNDVANDGPGTPINSPRLAQIDGDSQTLTAAATITCDASAKASATVVLNQVGHTLDITNALVGQRGRIAAYQDGTGSRTITTYKRDGSTANVKFPTNGVAPVLTTAVNGMDIIEWWFVGGDLLVWRSS